MIQTSFTQCLPCISLKIPLNLLILSLCPCSHSHCLLSFLAISSLNNLPLFSVFLTKNSFLTRLPQVTIPLSPPSQTLLEQESALTLILPSPAHLNLLQFGFYPQTLQWVFIQSTSETDHQLSYLSVSLFFIFLSLTQSRMQPHWCTIYPLHFRPELSSNPYPSPGHSSRSGPCPASLPPLSTLSPGHFIPSYNFNYYAGIPVSNPELSSRLPISGF